MIAEGINYQQAIDLIETLKKNGIEANITTGGISLNPKISDIDLAKQICTAAGAYVSQGHMTTLASHILFGIAEREAGKISPEGRKVE